MSFIVFKKIKGSPELFALSMIKQTICRAWNSNLLTAWSGQSVGVLRFLILTPIILTRFSDAEIAIYFLFGTVLSFAQLLDLGMAPTLTRYFAYASAGAPDLDSLVAKKRIEHGVPNWDLIGRIFSISGYIYLFISGLVFILIGGLATLAVAQPIGHLQDPSEGWKTWAVIVFSVLYTSYVARYRVYLRGRGQLALEQRISAIIALLCLASGTVALLCTESLFETFLAIQFFHVLGSFLMVSMAYFYESRRMMKLTSFGWDRELFSHILGPCWRTAVAVVSSVGVSRMSGLLLAQFIGPVALAPFLFAQRAVDFSSQLLSAPVMTQQPLLPRLRAQGKIAEIASIMQRRILFSLSSLALCLYFFGLVAQYLINFIGSNMEFLDPHIWFLYVIFALYDRFTAYNTLIYSSTNHIYFWGHALVSGALTLILSIMLVPDYGFVGFLISAILSRLLVFRIEPTIRSCKSLEIPSKEFLLKTTMPSVLFSILYLTYILL